MAISGCRILENSEAKVLISESIKYTFDKKSGYTRTWGRTEDDDPSYSPYGPMIADIELSTSCSQNCPMCYKSNQKSGADMTLEQFKTIFAKMPKTLTQIAFGLGDTPNTSGTRGNPDTFNIFNHARNNGVIPNCTINGFGLDRMTARMLADVCGAVAVSRYNPKDACYDAVKMLTDAGLVQTNVHALVAESTFADCLELLEDAVTDPRLAKLNAIVFLSGKKKGRGTWLTPLSTEKYRQLVHTAIKKGVGFGFDSCGAHKFLEAVRDSPQYPQYAMLAEPCESGIFSAYVDVSGTYYPCSFSDEAVRGINLFEVDDFMKDVWCSDEVEQWRKRLLGNCRKCPIFDI